MSRLTGITACVLAALSLAVAAVPAAFAQSLCGSLAAPPTGVAPAGDVL